LISKKSVDQVDNQAEIILGKFMHGILIEDVSRKFGSFQAVDRVNLGIKTGSLVALGPSGSGNLLYCG